MTPESAAPPSPKPKPSPVKGEGFRARARGLLAAGLAVALLAGCGFQPMHARAPVGPGVDAAGLDEVAIPMVLAAEASDARLAQLLRNELLDRISPRGEPASPRYHLLVSLEAETEGIIIRRDSTISRARLTARATYKLMQGDVLVEDGSARALTSFDLPAEGYFASVASARDSGQQAAVLLAEQISAALAAHFARRGTPARP